jgi:DNA-binding transcriptional MerR regulator
MLRIGDFSKLSRVSVKTLRYYDEMGLLKPVSVDRLTGYRSYEFGQLARLYRILSLKELGFSLEEIRRFLDEDLSVEQMRGMLRLRRAEIREQLDRQAERLGAVEHWLDQIQKEHNMTQYDVVIKQIGTMQVAARRGVVPTPPEQGPLWDELLGYLEQHKVQMNGTPMAIYHDAEARERDWDIEVAMPVGGAPAPEGRIQVYDLPGVESMACVVHAGSFATIGQAYDALAKWIDQNGYEIVGPSRELNLQMPAKQGDQNDPGTVNEIQFPVWKK